MKRDFYPVTVVPVPTGVDHGDDPRQTLTQALRLAIEGCRLARPGLTLPEAAQAGDRCNKVSTLHIPPIEVQMKDGTGGILQRDFYPVTSVPVPTGVGRSALV